MSKYSKEDIVRMVEEEDVEFIRLQFTDIFGMLKNVAITSSQLNKALENRCMFDGSAIEGFVRIDESDMYLYPDLDTFEIFPWRPQQGKVARLVCWGLHGNISNVSRSGYRYISDSSILTNPSMADQSNMQRLSSDLSSWLEVMATFLSMPKISVN